MEGVGEEGGRGVLVSSVISRWTTDIAWLLGSISLQERGPFSFDSTHLRSKTGKSARTNLFAFTCVL